MNQTENNEYFKNVKNLRELYIAKEILNNSGEISLGGDYEYVGASPAFIRSDRLTTKFYEAIEEEIEILNERNEYLLKSTDIQ